MKRILLPLLLILALLLSFCPSGLASDTYCITVYLDGSNEFCGDGSSPEQAVNSLAAAYECLSANQEFFNSSQASGLLILCGDLVQNESFLPEDFHKGKLTISSESDSVLHLGESGGGNRLNIQFPGPTCLKDLTINLLSATQKDPVTIYAGTDFTAEESFVLTRRGRVVTANDTDCYFNLRGGYRIAPTVVDDISLRLYGGAYRSITAGSDRHDTGDVELILDHKASVSVFLECGAVQSRSIGDVHLTLGKDQQVDTLYLYSHLKQDSDAVMGSLTMDIYGNVSSLQPQRNHSSGKARAVINGDLTMNLHPGGTISALGTDYALKTEQCVIAGDAVLNVFSYDGKSLYGLSHYDRVTLLGKDTALLTDQKEGVSVCGYEGDLGLELGGIAAVQILGSSDVSYLYEFPSDLPVFVEEGSVLRLSRERNMHLPTFASGNVVFLDTSSDPVSPVLWIDFEEEIIDRSGFANQGVISGLADYVEGYDGGTALAIHNSFGEKAQNYLSIRDLKGVDLSGDNYTILFQYRADCGGMDQWTGSGKEVDPNIGLNFQQLRAGGTLLSAGRFTLAHLPQNAYLTAALGDMSVGGMYQLQDGRWHMIAVTINQRENCRIYVDDIPVATLEIPEHSPYSNDLAIGADLFGSYGLGKGRIDDLKVYPCALTPLQIAEECLFRQSRTLLHEIRRYGETFEINFSEELSSGMEELASLLTESSSAEYRYEKYQELRTLFHTELERENEAYDMGLALISDVHIGKVGDAHAQAFGRVFDDFANIPNLKGVVIPGDFADNSTSTAVEAAFDSLDLLMGDQTSLQVFAAYGNHEVRYISEQECFNTGAVQFWEELQSYFHTSDDVRLDSVCNYSYAMTYNGYHFLILNTDNPGQHGNAATSDDPNADPIRRGMYLERSTLQWIEKLLTYYDLDEYPVFVIGHFPFADSVPFSGYSTDPLKDNSIGDQGPELANIFGRHDKLVYICGHLHSGLGISGPVTIQAENGGSFSQINLPSLKASPRGYMGSTASWYLFAAKDKILLRARDFLRGEWLTEYDAILYPISADKCSGDDTCPSGSFSDVAEQSWYHHQLDAAIQMGWIKGMSHSTFEPDISIDRAMLVTVLYRAAGEPKYTSTSPFLDVSPNAYYYHAVCWAAEKGIVKGISETQFAPNQPASREMIAVILHRMANLPKSDTLPPFTDAEQISFYAREALAWAAKEKIFTGYPDGSLRPGAPMSRAELVAVLVRSIYLFLS